VECDLATGSPPLCSVQAAPEPDSGAEDRSELSKPA
jgi:hypothetical protein